MIRILFRRHAVRSILFCALSALAGVQVHAQTGAEDGVTAPLEPGDVIRIKVWREPDLSGDITVGDDGAAAIPRLGYVDMTSVSLGALRQQIINEYSRTLVDATIEVRFLRRVRVFGAVRTPGLYPVEDGLTVADAIALAGGVAEEGSYDKVELVRGAGGNVVRMTRSAGLADVDVRSGDEVFVPKRGWVRRNAATLFGTSLTSIAIIRSGR